MDPGDSSQAAQLPSIGGRVVDGNGFRGTVRYVGPVCTAKDPTTPWIGVEFDDPARGKHDGAVEKPDGSSVRYFTCVNGGSGSFLKPSKFSTGISMAEALRQQYVDMNAPLLAPENLLPDAYASTSKGGKKVQTCMPLGKCATPFRRKRDLCPMSSADQAIEFYGESKIRQRQQVDTLDHCTLRECSISKAGELPALAEAAGAFVSVDLKANLLSDWQEVGLIASQTPLLEILSVGSNMFKTPEGVPPSLSSGACGRLRVLEITSCGITSWSQVAMLGEWAPSLEELYAADNDVSDVSDVVAPSTSGNGHPSGEKRVGGFRRLIALDLSETELTSWEQVACFSALPALSTLLLNHNRVADVDLITSTTTSTSAAAAESDGTNPGPASGDQVEGDKGGKHNHNDGQGGAASSSIAPPFAVLSAISLSGNRIGDWGAVDRLAGLPSLRSLRFSGNPVTSGLGASEAQESEEKGGQGLTKGEAEQRLAERHPRQVTLISLAAVSCTVEPIKKKLPASSLTVGKLKQLCKRLFKVDTDQQVLSHRPEPGALLSTLDDDEKTLSYFCVGDGSEVLVNEIDERQQERDKERARQEEEGRLAEQLRHADALTAIRRGQVRKCRNQVLYQ
ncbi:unnamed protein product [Ectocarpus sp. CCAP 1310/34]|nr:unnamed protein product [Ectocarpus sp. CCAP 1310/34]